MSSVSSQLFFEGLGYQKMTELLLSNGVNAVHARPLFRAIHRELWQGSERLLEGFPPPLERWLKCEKAPKWTAIDARHESISEDGWTRKYLLELADKRSVEAVQMGFPGRYTACLSSQVGCAMGCVFCATGQMGYGRQLEVHEIVAQAYHVERAIRRKDGGRLRNLVMMGMGEPLHNFERVMAALDLLTDTRGLNIGPARVAISTVGYVPGIKSWRAIRSVTLWPLAFMEVVMKNAMHWCHSVSAGPWQIYWLLVVNILRSSVPVYFSLGR